MEFHPCGICGVHVLETDEAIQCDGICSLWHHRECLGMTLAEYLKLSKGQEDWFCRKCVVKQEIKQEAEAERRRQRKSEMGKSKIECKKLEVLKGDQKCVFCHQTNIDEIKYGPIYMHKNIITHYYCLLLSSNMEQNGRDCDGILGFLPSDISKEVRRGVRLFCTFCKSGGATLGCAIAKCKVVFHLPCGMKHGTLHQFFGEFKSYCAKHRPVQRIGAKILAEASKNAMCGICYEKVVPRPIHETLWAPCCQKSAFFHRDCVQQLATSAGYFFKCPLCNNTSAFQKEMKEYGIYIPEQDASWESVPNAYQDLLVRHDTCDCATCSCPTGRKTNNQGTRWELILCKFCGSQGIHIGCGRLKWKSPEFVCDTCSGNNEREEEANTRNYHGNRHRLTGPGRTAEIHPSVSADRERERSDDNSSDESQKVTLTNRRGRRRVISPLRVSTPPPDTIHMKSEKHGKRSEPTSTIKVDDSPVLDDVTVVIDDSDDSDDDVEVVSETKGSCLKTNDGSTIPIIQVKDNVKKRLNVEGDVNILPEEIVDITIQMDGPPLKKAPSPHVEEVIYSFPSLTQKPSTSTSYCTPSTSFTAPPDVTKFVLVDPSTFRPEDLPPGTVLYRSFTPMVPMPPTSTPMQPQVQPTPAGQVPMPQLGRAGGRGADAKHPNLGEHRGRSSFHLHAPTRHTKKTSRSNKHNSFGRRGRGRCDHDRLNPRVLVSPLKYRISNDGFFEILLPRRNLGFGFGHGSFKRKASPLPSRPAKKIKVSSKDPTVTKNKKSLKKGKPGNNSTNTKEKISKSRAKRKDEKKNTKCSQDNQILQKDSEEITHNSGSTQIPTFFSSKKELDRKKSKKLSTSAKRDCGAGKENASPELIVKKKRREIVLMEWKYKRIDEYLSKIKSEPINDHEKTNSSNAEEESSKIVVSLLDELIGFVVEKYLYEKPPTAGSDTDKDASSLDIMNETNFSVQSNASNSESANKQINTSSDANPGSSPDICKTTNNFTGNNFLMMTESVDMFEEGQVCEANHKYITHELLFPALEVTSDFKNVGKTVDKSSNLVMNTKTESEVFVSHQIGISDRDVSCETSNNEDTSPATNKIDRTQDILKDCISSIKPSVSAKDFSHHEYSVGSLTDEISPSHIEGFVSAGQSLSWSINRVGEVNMKTNDNTLQITSSLCKKTNSVTTHGLFPKIKIKASKVKSHVNIKNNVLKSGQCVKKSKVKTKAESKININDVQIPITKKRRIENVTLKGKGESNTEAMEQSKTKANVKEMRPPKTKRKKVDKHSPICKIGAIDKYFSPITRDCFNSPNKTFGDMTNGNKNSGKDKEQDSIPPPPAKLENNRFWKTLNAQNSPDKEKKINFPSTTVKLENGILQRYLNNQSSPQKIPLMELKFNNTETPNAVKAIQFDVY